MSSNHRTIVVGMTQQEASDLQQKLGKVIEKVESGNVEINTPSPDPVIEQLVAELRRRSAAGLQKYGKPLSRDDLKLIDWLRHALEEKLDNAGYLQAAINSLESGQTPTASDPPKEPAPDTSQHFLALMYGLKIPNPSFWLTQPPSAILSLGEAIARQAEKGKDML